MSVFLLVPQDEEFHASVGGPQEHGRRAGTENVASAIAMVEALETVEEYGLSDVAELRGKARDVFENAVCSKLDIHTIGGNGPRLWNTSMILLPHTKNLKWLTRLSRRKFAVSTGSACSAGKGKSIESHGGYGTRSRGDGPRAATQRWVGDDGGGLVDVG